MGVKFIYVGEYIRLPGLGLGLGLGLRGVPNHEGYIRHFPNCQGCANQDKGQVAFRSDQWRP